MLILSVLLIFTSHYVPIKSKHKCLKQKRVAKFTSHYVPIKSAAVIEKLFNNPLFTSHYVPIKSPIHLLLYYEYRDLHPIMFLLNQKSHQLFLYMYWFTSHYVPIKSISQLALSDPIHWFTSHYVPIKSRTYCYHI